MFQGSRTRRFGQTNIGLGKRKAPRPMDRGRDQIRLVPRTDVTVTIYKNVCGSSILIPFREMCRFLVPSRGVCRSPGTPPTENRLQHVQDNLYRIYFLLSSIYNLTIKSFIQGFLGAEEFFSIL